MASHRLNMTNPIRWSLKTAGGLLLIIIACMVVGMLGYHAYEGFSQTSTRTRPRVRRNPLYERVNEAERVASGTPSTSNRRNIQSVVNTLAEPAV